MNNSNNCQKAHCRCMQMTSCGNHHYSDCGWFGSVDTKEEWERELLRNMEWICPCRVYDTGDKESDCPRWLKLKSFISQVAQQEYERGQIDLSKKVKICIEEARQSELERICEVIKKSRKEIPLGLLPDEHEEVRNYNFIYNKALADLLFTLKSNSNG